MQLNLTHAEIRSWRTTDVKPLSKYANNKKIWLNLRDAFPHPYTPADAEAFIKSAGSKDPETFFAITREDEVIGSIGYKLNTDVERVSTEIGYWLGEQFWGKGIMTEVVCALTRYAIEQHQLTRVYAMPFEWSHGSCRVLEKAGFELECRMRKSAIKEGKIIDQFLYAYVPE